MKRPREVAPVSVIDLDTVEPAIVKRPYNTMVKRVRAWKTKLRRSFYRKRRKWVSAKQKAWFRYKAKGNKINYNRLKLRQFGQAGDIPSYQVGPIAFTHITQVPRGVDMSDREGAEIYIKKLRARFAIHYDNGTYGNTDRAGPLLLRLIMIQAHEELAGAPSHQDVLEALGSFGVNARKYWQIAPHKVNPAFKYTTLYDKQIILKAKDYREKLPQINIKVRPKKRIRKVVFKRDHGGGNIGDIKKGSIWFCIMCSENDSVAVPRFYAMADAWWRMTFATSQ